MISLEVEDFVSVDPGEKRCGYAVFTDGQLVHVGAVVTPPQSEQWLRTALYLSQEIGSWAKLGYRLYVEEMKIRRGWERAHGSMLEISRMTGALGAFWTVGEGLTPRLVDPAKWTKRAGKGEHQQKTKELLDEKEKTLLESYMARYETECHSEMVDAVGIGLYVLGRRL